MVRLGTLSLNLHLFCSREPRWARDEEDYNRYSHFKQNVDDVRTHVFA